MRRIQITKRSDKKWHIEAPGCIVNITHSLIDTTGHEVTSVEILCDDADGMGNAAWRLRDFESRKGMNVRVRNVKKHEGWL